MATNPSFISGYQQFLGDAYLAGKIDEQQYSNAMQSLGNTVQSDYPPQQQPATTQQPSNSQLATIQQQNITFKQALDSGKITQAQYNEAMLFQNQQYAIAQGYEIAGKPSTEAEALARGETEYIPEDEKQKYYDEIKDYYLKTQTLAGTKVPVTVHDPNAPLSKSTYGYADAFGNVTPSAPILTPVVPSQQPSMTDLDSPLQKGILGKNPNVFGATGIAGVTPVINTQQKANIASALTAIVAAPVLAPAIGVSSTSVLVGEGLSVGINQIFKGVTGGGLLTPEEALYGAAEGGVFAVAGGAVFQGVGKVAPSVVSSLAGRTAIGAGLGGGIGYVTSGGDLQQTAIGMGLGAGLTLGTELLGVPVYNEVKAKLPTKIGGSVLLTEGDLALGADGRVAKTFISKPLPELDGKRLRIIADVTENPVGFKGVTEQSMFKQYVNTKVPTSHATLTPENFNLKAGGETLLRGFPEQSAGFRNAKQLYHFYAAPGTGDYVNIYGGYIGIGKGYSAGVPKISFSGKPTALVTLETKVSGSFAKGASESENAYLSRISKLSGRTGLAPETVLGYSAERQLVTPSQYTRFGEVLPGSKFISEGKVGTFQIKSLPSGKIGKIPILRTSFADYTNLNVVKGKYTPVTGKATKTVTKTFKSQNSYVRQISVSSPKVTALLPSVANIGSPEKSVPKLFSSPSAKTVSVPSLGVSKFVSSIGKSTVSKSVSSGLSGSSPSIGSSNFKLSSDLSLVSEPSKSSGPSMPSYPSYPSKPSYPKPSMPSYPKPSKPSAPSYPKPSLPSPSAPSYPNPIPPSYPKSPSPKMPTFSTQSYAKTNLYPPMAFGGGFDRKGQGGIGSKWFQKRHKIKTYTQMLGTFGLGPAAKPMRMADKALSTPINKLEKKLFKRRNKR